MVILANLLSTPQRLATHHTCTPPYPLVEGHTTLDCSAQYQLSDRPLLCDGPVMKCMEELHAPAHALGQALAVDGRDAADEQQLRCRALLFGSRLLQYRQL